MEDKNIVTFPKIKLTFLQRFWIRVLRSGTVPRHVAIIIDGNRRYAKQNDLTSYEGHYNGYKKVDQILKFCMELGVHEVTLYFFSIYNFKRSSAEVANIFGIINMWLEDLYKNRELLKDYGIRIAAIGNLRLIPESMCDILAKVQKETKNSNTFVINCAMAYSGREEIYNAVMLLLEGVQQSLIKPEDITADVLQQCLYLPQEPDILIRSSGEVRLSDFLLWQSSYSMLMFKKCLWPEFSGFDGMTCILEFQKKHTVLQKFQSRKMEDENRNAILNKMSKEMANNSDKHLKLQKEREIRLRNLYSHIENKNSQMISSMLHQ